MSAPPMWKHQRDAVDWVLSRRGSYLHIPMGGGKSRCVVEAAEESGASRVLILCPKAVVGSVWPGEFGKYGRREWAVFPWTTAGSSTKIRLRRLGEAMQRAAIDGRPFAVVINYEAARTPAVENALRGKRWDLVIMDEAQKLKSHRGKASKAVARIVRESGRRVGLSGTPMPHSPLDVFGQYQSIEPGTFGGSFFRFRQRFAVLGGFQGKVVVGYQNEDKLQQLLSSTMFSPEPGAINLDLPEARHEVIKVDMESKGRKLYDALAADTVAEIEEGTINAANGLVRLLRMQQLTSGVAVVEEQQADQSDDAMRKRMRAIVTGADDGP